MIIEAGAASVIAVKAHSPFGETERSAGRWLPYLRLLAAIALAGLRSSPCSSARSART
jgi:hypothetical protein